MISLDKRQPKYLYRLNLAGVLFFVLWFALGVPLMVTIGCIYDESAITYIVMACTFAVFFIGLAILVIVGAKLNKRLIEERTARLEEEFSEMPFEEAERILKENGVIDNSGFICADNIFGETVVPFNQACFAFGVHVKHTNIVLEIAIGRNGEDKAYAIQELDAELYNFLLKSDFDLSGNYIFDLFVNDKKAFAEYVLKFHKPLK